MFTLHVLAPTTCVVLYLQRGVCFVRDDVLLGAHHLAFNCVFMGMWCCGCLRCECIVVWGYIYTLFTLISGHSGTNREMCGLERGKLGSASSLLIHLVVFLSSLRSSLPSLIYSPTPVTGDSPH